MEEYWCGSFVVNVFMDYVVRIGGCDFELFESIVCRMVFDWLNFVCSIGCIVWVLVNFVKILIMWLFNLKGVEVVCDYI